MNTRDNAFDFSGWVTVKEAAKMLGVSRAWVYVLLERGVFRSVSVLGRRLLLREDVAALQKERKRQKKTPEA